MLPAAGSVWLVRAACLPRPGWRATSMPDRQSGRHYAPDNTIRSGNTDDGTAMPAAALIASLMVDPVVMPKLWSGPMFRPDNFKKFQIGSIRRCACHGESGSSSRSAAALLVAHAGKAPADHGRFERAARFLVEPFAVGIETGEGQLIGAAVILAEHFDCLSRRRFSIAIELRQPLFTRSHSVHLPRNGSSNEPHCPIEVSVWYDSGNRIGSLQFHVFGGGVRKL